jgi:acyl carrier protein
MVATHYDHRLKLTFQKMFIVELNMSNLSLEDRVKQLVVKQLGVEESAVIGKAKFIEDLGADSLDIVELVMAMEEAFGVDIPDEEAENIRTVDDAVQFIKRAGEA